MTYIYKVCILPNSYILHGVVHYLYNVVYIIIPRGIYIYIIIIIITRVSTCVMIYIISYLTVHFQPLNTCYINEMSLFVPCDNVHVHTH